MSRSHETKGLSLDLERIVFIGRTYEEYLNMFDLSEQNLRGLSILDCPAGACSFTAEGCEKGLEVTATDIAYQFNPVELEAKGLADLHHVFERMQGTQQLYDWSFYGTLEHHREHRERALSLSTLHRKEHPTRYVSAVLPELPFADGSFDLTLSAHFLFSYGDRLDHEFHCATLSELIRVTRDQIRIFPLVDGTGKKYDQLNDLCKLAATHGWLAEEKGTAYRFQQGADSYLLLSRVQE